MTYTLPENPNLYKIILAVISLGIAFVNGIIERNFWSWLTLFFLGLGTMVFVWGISGLNKAYELEQEKKKKEIDLSNAKIETEKVKRKEIIANLPKNYTSLNSAHDFQEKYSPYI